MPRPLAHELGIKTARGSSKPLNPAHLSALRGSPKAVRQKLNAIDLVSRPHVLLWPIPSCAARPSGRSLRWRVTPGPEVYVASSAPRWPSERAGSTWPSGTSLSPTTAPWTRSRGYRADWMYQDLADSSRPPTRATRGGEFDAPASAANSPGDGAHNLWTPRGGALRRGQGGSIRSLNASSIFTTSPEWGAPYSCREHPSTAGRPFYCFRRVLHLPAPAFVARLPGAALAGAPSGRQGARSARDSSDAYSRPGWCDTNRRRFLSPARSAPCDAGRDRCRHQAHVL